MARIEITNLSKHFYSAKSRAPVIRRLTLSVDPGQILCLVGPNGSGKTTLLKILAGLTLPSAGSVHLDSIDVHKDRSRAAAKIGALLADAPGFYDRLTGRENLTFFSSLYGLSGKAFRAGFDHAAGLLGLEQLDRPFQEYSSGAKQRLRLARALLHEPEVLLLDEPAKSLDADSRSRLRDWLKEASSIRKKTVIISTHEEGEARALDGRVLALPC